MTSSAFPPARRGKIRRFDKADFYRYALGVMEAESRQRMQRVRIGLTGLAFVFVLVLLATAIVRPSGEAPLNINMFEPKAGAPGTNAVDPDARQEPLAELGVAPGNAETNNSAAASAAPVAPAGSRPQQR
jgi:hypothetical protein